MLQNKQGVKKFRTNKSKKRKNKLSKVFDTTQQKAKKELIELSFDDDFHHEQQQNILTNPNNHHKHLSTHSKDILAKIKNERVIFTQTRKKKDSFDEDIDLPFKCQSVQFKHQRRTDKEQNIFNFSTFHNQKPLNKSCEAINKKQINLEIINKKNEENRNIISLIGKVHQQQLRQKLWNDYIQGSNPQVSSGKEKLAQALSLNWFKKTNQAFPRYHKSLHKQKMEEIMKKKLTFYRSPFVGQRPRFPRNFT